MMDSGRLLSGVDGGVQVSSAVVPELHMKLSTLTVLLCVSLLCGFSAVWTMRRAVSFTSDAGSRHRVLSLMSCFASGVFLATVLLERLPDYLNHMRQTFSYLGVMIHFPLPEFILAMGFLVVFVVEQILLAFRDQSCDLSYEKQSLLAVSVQPHDKDTTKHPSQHSGKGSSRRNIAWTDRSCCAEDIRSHAGLQVTLLMFCLCPNAIFEGLAITMLGGERLLEICLALVLHEGIIAVSLAFRLMHSNLRRSVVAAGLFLFSVMCPAGIGLGVILAEVKLSPQIQLVLSAVEGLISGIFINITVMGLVWQELGSPNHRIYKVAFLLTGFAVVTGVLFIKI